MERHIVFIQRLFLKKRVGTFFEKFKLFFRDLSTLAQLNNDQNLIKKINTDVVQTIASRFIYRVNRAINLHISSDIAVPLTGRDMLTAYQIAGYPDVVLDHSIIAHDLYRLSVQFVQGIDRCANNVTSENLRLFFKSTIEYSNCLLIGGSYDIVEEKLMNIKYILKLHHMIDNSINDPNKQITICNIQNKINEIIKNLNISNIDIILELAYDAFMRNTADNKDKLYIEISRLSKTDNSFNSMFRTIQDLNPPERRKIIYKSWIRIGNNQKAQTDYLKEQLFYVRQQRLHIHIFIAHKIYRDQHIL